MPFISVFSASHTKDLSKCLLKDGWCFGLLELFLWGRHKIRLTLLGFVYFCFWFIKPAFFDHLMIIFYCETYRLPQEFSCYPCTEAMFIFSLPFQFSKCSVESSTEGFAYVNFEWITWDSKQWVSQLFLFQSHHFKI